MMTKHHLHLNLVKTKHLSYLSLFTSGGTLICCALPALLVGLGLFLTSLNGFATPSYKVTVNGMVCSFCAQGIEKKMKALSETKDVYVGLKNRLVVVEVKEGLTLSQDVIRKIIKDAGYEVKSIEVSEHPIEHIKSGADK